MDYKKEFCLMVDPKTGNPRLIEPSDDPDCKSLCETSQEAT
jgi:hypothetical protein